MAITSGVSMNDLNVAGTIGCWPLLARRWLTTPPHALAAGEKITGLGPLVDSSGQPWLSRVACVPDDTLFTCTNTQPPLLAADDPLNSWASLVSRSTFSGELTTGMVAHPLGAL